MRSATATHLLETLGIDRAFDAIDAENRSLREALLQAETSLEHVENLASKAQTERDAYEAGFLFASQHPNEPVIGAKQRDLYRGNQTCRIEWDRGFDHERVARRLGHDTASMASAGNQAVSHLDEGTVISGLLDQINHLKDMMSTADTDPPKEGP